MDTKTYEQLKKDIPVHCDHCAEKFRALDVVFGLGKPQRMGPAKGLPAFPSGPAAEKKFGKTLVAKKAFKNGDVLTTTVAQPKPEKDPLIGEPCGIKDCTVKLRSKANTCAVCSKRVCSKDWDKVADCCTACALVAR